MKPAAFAYAKAFSLDHAIELLGGASAEARVLAGGQSLIATLNMRLSSPDLLVDINAVPGLDGIAVKDGMLEIGALVRHAQAERSDVVARHAPLIAMALPHIGHAAIRNRGSVAAEQFFRGLFETALSPRDVLTAIRVPLATRDSRFGFAEFSRRHGDYAMVGLAAQARVEGAALRDPRLVYFGVGATPVRARNAEAALAADPLRIAAAASALARDLDPPDDLQASAAVKKHLAGVLLERVAQQLMAGHT